MKFRLTAFLGAMCLIALALIGWRVLFTQNPGILLKARLRYIQAIKINKIDLANGPCLGKIDDNWVLDIAHVPRETIDDDLKNQCTDYQLRKVHHFVEMSPKGEIIYIK